MSVRSSSQYIGVRHTQAQDTRQEESKEEEEELEEEEHLLRLETVE